MMRVLVDADVILELFLNRSGFVENIEKLLEEAEKTKSVELYVTDKCLRRIPLELDDANSELAEQSVAFIKRFFNDRIIKIDSALKEQARKYALPDFDSALELACAIEMYLGAIVTLNPSNFCADVDLGIWSPAELLQRLPLEKNARRDEAREHAMLLIEKLQHAFECILEWQHAFELREAVEAAYDEAKAEIEAYFRRQAVEVGRDDLAQIAISSRKISDDGEACLDNFIKSLVIPFDFANGLKAYTSEELVRLCQKFRSEAINHLMTGHFDPWLKDIGRDDLAQIAISSRKISDDDEACLDNFIKSL